MPLQLTISQETGVNATYHVFKDASVVGGQAVFNSYLDQPSFAAGKLPLNTITLDVTAIFAQPAMTPPAGATLLQAVTAVIEGYALTTPTFTGATQVA